jgi:hypothetical protein
MLRVEISRTKRVKTKRTSLPCLVSHNVRFVRSSSRLVRLRCQAVLEFSFTASFLPAESFGVWEVSAAHFFVRSQRNPRPS